MCALSPASAEEGDAPADEQDEAATNDTPRVSKLSWTASDGSWTQSAILDFAAIAVLGVGRETSYPELGRLRGGEPEALRIHIGALGDYGRAAYVVRLDIAETLRIIADDVRERPLVAGNRLLDAAYGVARLGDVRLLIGRQAVAVSRFQDVPTSLLAAGATPFVIDRILPGQRWGARAKLDRGRFGVAAGAWLDGDSIEPRIVPEDPAIGSRAALSAVASLHAIGPRALHWLADTNRLSIRAGVLARFGDKARVDGLVGAELTQGRFAALLEILTAADDGGVRLSTAGELTMLVHPKSAIFVRGEHDGGRDIFSTGAGISYFATDDRRNRMALYGWLRRDRDGISERDGVVLELQAEL